MSNVLERLENIIDKLPDSFPEKVKDLIKKPILGNKDLQDSEGALKDLKEELQKNIKD